MGVAHQTKAERTAKEIAFGPWAEAKRAEGAVIAVIGKNGSYYHTDPEFAPLIGRAKLANNGFEMIPPAYAAQGAAMMAEHGTRPSRAWFPYKSDDGSLVWCRIESNWDAALMVTATWREEDPEKHVLHNELID